MQGCGVELASSVLSGDTEVVLGDISTTTVPIVDSNGGNKSLQLHSMILFFIFTAIAIGFTQARHRASEDTGGVPVTVVLSGRLETTITVRMYTVDGVATSKYVATTELPLIKSGFFLLGKIVFPQNLMGT